MEHFYWLVSFAQSLSNWRSQESWSGVIKVEGRLASDPVWNTVPRWQLGFDRSQQQSIHNIRGAQVEIERICVIPGESMFERYFARITLPIVIRLICVLKLAETWCNCSGLWTYRGLRTSVKAVKYKSWSSTLWSGAATLSWRRTDGETECSQCKSCWCIMLNSGCKDWQ